MTNTTNTERLKDVLRSALALCEWIDESPHRRGSINGQASQVAHSIRAALAEVGVQAVPKRCPACKSPSPELHPAQAHEGEVSICPNPWHGTSQQTDAAAPEAPRTALTDEHIDAGLDLILRAAGSALKHYTMQKSRDEMRTALRFVITVAQGKA